MKRVNIDGENLHIFNNLKNFSDIFRKDVIYDNIKIIKKQQDLILSLKNTILEKPEGEFQTELPSLLRIKTLI